MNGGFLGVPDRAEAVPGLALHTASFLLYHASMPGTVCHRHATLRRTLPGWLSEATCCHPHDRGRVRRCARPPSGPGPTPVGPGRGLVQVPRAATRPPTPGTTDLRTTRWPDRWRGGAKHPPPLRSDRPLSVPVVASSRFPARPPALRHQEQPTFGPPGGPIVGEASRSTPRHSRTKQAGNSSRARPIRLVEIAERPEPRPVPLPRLLRLGLNGLSRSTNLARST